MSKMSGSMQARIRRVRAALKRYAHGRVWSNKRQQGYTVKINPVCKRTVKIQEELALLGLGKYTFKVRKATRTAIGLGRYGWDSWIVYLYEE